MRNEALMHWFYENRLPSRVIPDVWQVQIMNGHARIYWRHRDGGSTHEVSAPPPRGYVTARIGE